MRAHHQQQLFSKVDIEAIEHFENILSKENVLRSSEALSSYGSDHTEDIECPPEIVLRPTNSIQCSRIMAFCNKQNIPITPYAAGTGLSGGAIPVFGGVVLSTKKMDKILCVDVENMFVEVEPGVINQHLRDVVEPLGFFYPPDPASLGSCTIGGNIAESSGGPRAVKYGTTKDYILDLEVVLPNGNIIRTGAPVHKNSTGYNLTQLMVGSEGTLGIITRAWLKIIPLPKYEWLMEANFRNPIEACAAVSKLLYSGILPSTLEFMEKDALAASYEYQGIENVEIPESQLLIGFDGPSMEEMERQAFIANELLEGLGCEDVKLANDSNGIERLWKTRRSMGLAVKSISAYKEEDAVVPPAKLPALLEKVKSLEKQYGFKSYCYGHAGDGNLHINIVKKGMSDQKWNEELPAVLEELFQYVHKLNGRLSGEHGVGLVQKNFMPIFFSEVELEIMRGIKKLFDPKGILNPGKIFPESD